jgi:hypothetical protein
LKKGKNATRLPIVTKVNHSHIINYCLYLFSNILS